MENQNVTYCQSCGMPLNTDVLGTNSDGSKNNDYCTYCFKSGKFTADISMNDMIEFCIPHMVNANKNINEEKARSMMKKFFPTLKRWNNL